MSGGFVDLPAGRFHYRRWTAGPAAPCAILVHGTGSSSTTWARVGPALRAAGAEVFALDLRGCGSSVRCPPGSYDLPAIAGDLQDFIDALHVRAPVVVGHCWGAAAALTLATGASRPALGGLVLEELPRGMAPTLDKPVVRDFLTLMGRPREYVEKWVELVCRSWAVEDRRNLVEDICGTDPDIYLSAVKDGAEAGPLFPLLARLEMPTMFLRGNPRRGGMLDDADWTLAQRCLPVGADVHEFESSGHEIHRGDDATYVRLVADFLHKNG
jgi:pimeloyl-ACP methyl ester carboxylesterase